MNIPIRRTSIRNPLKTAGGVILRTGVFFIIALLALVLFGAGGPVVFLMFFGVYFVLGTILQIFVRLVPQPDEANQPTPWSQFFGYAFTFVIGTGAVLAIFRLLYRGLSVLDFDQKGAFIFQPTWDYFFGACGLIYAFVSFTLEGLWRYRQMLAVKELATIPVEGISITVPGCPWRWH